jgi:hypothetical protein
LHVEAESRFNNRIKSGTFSENESFFLLLSVTDCKSAHLLKKALFHWKMLHPELFSF